MAFVVFRRNRRGYARRRFARRRYYSGASSYRLPAKRRRRATTTGRRKTMRSKCACPQAELTPGDKFLLAQADPFEPRALGAKVPDSNTVPSVAVSLTELLGFGLAAAGDARCIALLPTFTSSIVQSTTASSSAWTWSAAYGGTSSWSKRPDFSNTFELTRPVAHGVRITSNNAPTTSTGFVHIAVANESFRASTSWPYAVNIAEMSGYSWYKRVTIASLTQSPLTVINKYVDETAFRYEDAASLNAGDASSMEFHVPWGWGAILIAVEGAATTTPIQMEMILHHESIPKQSAVLMGSTAAAYSPGVISATSHMVANSDFTHTEDQQDQYVSRSLSTAAQAIGDAVIGGA